MRSRDVLEEAAERSRDVLEEAAERSRVGLRERLERVRLLLPTLVLGAAAAALSWEVAEHIVGKRGAFFAPVAAIITLGLSAGQRLRRAVELSIAVPLGIAMADILVLQIGSGPWQLGVIVLLALVAAVMLGGGPLLVTQAAVSAVLAVTLAPASASSSISFTRAADALIGCGVALGLNFGVFPGDPLRMVRLQADPVIRELAAVLGDAAAALQHRDRDEAVAALERGRAIDGYLQRFFEALNAGRQTANAAPQRRGLREPLAVFSEAGGQIDLAVRNARVLARGVLRAIDTGDRVPPGVPAAVQELSEAVACLAPWPPDPRRSAAVVDRAVAAARHASDVLEQTTNLSVSVLVGQVRSTAVDLLRSTGMGPEEARALVRAADEGRGARTVESEDAPQR